MNPTHSTQRRPGSVILIGVILLAALSVQCQQIASRSVAGAKPSVPTEPDDLDLREPILATVDRPIIDPLEDLARNDPLEFLRSALKKYRREVHDYRCTFTKQERVGGKLRDVETIRVEFVEDPYSVLMTWPSPPRPAQRVLYVQDKWTDSEGRPMAEVHPEPILALLLPRTKQPINGKIAEGKSRRKINEFGFGRTLELIIKYSEMARTQGVLELEYKGRSSVDGHPTYVFERHLPYTGEDGPYPDSVLIAHLDQKTLLPIAVDTFSDRAETRLLGRYRLSDIELNVGLSPADFSLD